MDVVLLIEAPSYEKVRRILLRDEVVSRASLIFREASIVQKEGYYCWISGGEEACNVALRISQIINSFAERGVVREVKGAEKDEVIAKLKEETSKAVEGFGGIFG
jgi:hypothetical protein